MTSTTGLIDDKKQMTMLDYLFYKLYQVTLKSSLNDIPQFVASAYLGCLISINTIVISAILAKLDVAPFLFANSTHGGIFAMLMIVFMLFYYQKKRSQPILEKYALESEKERIMGNIIVGIYVSLSIIFLFAVAFIRPEKL
jgi:hypothetical protein